VAGSTSSFRIWTNSRAFSACALASFSSARAAASSSHSCSSALRLRRRGVAPVEPPAAGLFARQVFLDLLLVEQRHGAGADRLGFVAIDPHALDVAIDRLVEGHARRQDPHQIAGQVRVDLHHLLVGGGFGALQLALGVFG
jgi:hypothetical protein